MTEIRWFNTGVMVGAMLCAPDWPTKLLVVMALAMVWAAVEIGRSIGTKELD